ncbi:Uncharacterised protein [Vibrio cholerae]|nr:Uncharacterised protein [Vibrio cholerae]CSD25312.1 Uncharacterised protein [Vibrio cholerae]CSD71279.1 Uncharacterised protein [Vibrio cholerae]
MDLTRRPIESVLENGFSPARAKSRSHPIPAVHAVNQALYAQTPAFRPKTVVHYGREKFHRGAEWCRPRPKPPLSLNGAVHEKGVTSSYVG